jgi:KaiC/GvpD/RAD55 family RecA-like ATPase
MTNGHVAHRLHEIESEAFRLKVLIDCGEYARDKAIALLIDAAELKGLCRTPHERENVEHVIHEGLAGRSAGLGLAPRALNNMRPPPHALLKALNLAEFLKMELPPRRSLLSPWLSEKSLAMVYSPRGVGKTLFALGIAYAIASGTGFLDWKATDPRHVLYIDGEMPAVEMQRRLAAIIGAVEIEAAADFFKLLSADASPVGLPDLATREGQRTLDDAIGDAAFVVADNISTLVRAGKENEAESWASVQEWALAHRRSGRTLLFVHHSGKTGAQRGTSKREDVLDTVIALRRPSDYSPREGARFEVHYDKARGFYGADAQPFEARYEVRAGAAVWTRAAITDAELDRVANTIGEGLSVRETAKALNIPKSTVHRLKMRAEKEGLLNAVSQCPAD